MLEELKEELTDYVAPFAGAWIEMMVTIPFLSAETRRTLRGCVD